jgi:hypothetical protein
MNRLAAFARAFALSLHDVRWRSSRLDTKNKALVDFFN